jgi:hypothetical protein
MESKPEPLRERLLAQFEPDVDRLASYRKEIQAMLANQERALRFQKWYAAANWIFVVALGTVFLTMAGVREMLPPGPLLGFLSCFFLIGGAVELLKCFMNGHRVELLKELKGLELQLLEIKEQMRRN